MYLSSLLIDLGANPDRPRPGRLWLRNLYHVHQRLCMAFPSESRKTVDPDFLKPYDPKDFNEGHVHVERKTNSGFLFRIDPHPNGRAVILVQSAIKPDWDYAFHNAGYLLAAPPEVKSIEPSFTKDQRLRFRLVASPMKKVGTIKKEERESLKKEGNLKNKEGRHGRRILVPTDQLIDWLARKGESGGFSIDKDSTAIQPGYIYMKKVRDGDGQRLRSVRYEGILEVIDPDSFRDTLIRGIGPAKAFGFGLLSVAPIPSEAK